MTDPTLPGNAPSCPDCGAPPTGAASCPGCGLRLRGPEAGRLWQVDVALAGVESRRSELLRERSLLLDALRPGTSFTPAVEQVTAGPGAAAPGAVAFGLPPAAGGVNWQPPVPGQPARPAQPAREGTPQRVQNSLLGLGVLLLTVAATYEQRLRDLTRLRERFDGLA